MQFRYKLAKETFKGKKVPPKNRVADDHVSADQRGNEARVGDQILSLDKDTVSTVAPKQTTEVSRRDLFGFGRLGAYADQLSEKFKEPPKPEKKKKKRKVKKKRAGELEPTEPQATVLAPATATINPATTIAETKPGFFRRLWHWLCNLFRKTPKAEVSLPVQIPAERPTDDLTTAPATQAITTQEAGIAASAPGTTPPKAEQEEIPLPEKSGFAKLFDFSEESQEPEPEMSRRHLLRQSVHFLAKPMVDSMQSKVDQVNEALDKVTKRVPLLRPPGAISERQFLQACTRCDECVHACPKDAIKKAPKSFGLLVLGTPYIDPLKKPCVMCDDLPCITVCPEGALLPVASPADVRMGYAILDEKKCMAYGSDSFCQQCVVDCPIPGAITQVNQRPVIHKNICTGCGVCLKSCNTVNIPVAIKIKPQMVIESQIRKREMEKLKARQEAEKTASATSNPDDPAMAEEDEEITTPPLQGDTRGGNGLPVNQRISS